MMPFELSSSSSSSVRPTWLSQSCSTEDCRPRVEPSSGGCSSALGSGERVRPNCGKSDVASPPPANRMSSSSSPPASSSRESRCTICGGRPITARSPASSDCRSSTSMIPFSASGPSAAAQPRSSSHDVSDMASRTWEHKCGAHGKGVVEFVPLVSAHQQARARGGDTSPSETLQKRQISFNIYTSTDSFTSPLFSDVEDDALPPLSGGGGWGVGGSGMEGGEGRGGAHVTLQRHPQCQSPQGLFAPHVYNLYSWHPCSQTKEGRAVSPASQLALGS